MQGGGGFYLVFWWETRAGGRFPFGGLLFWGEGLQIGCLTIGGRGPISLTQRVLIFERPIPPPKINLSCRAFLWLIYFISLGVLFAAWRRANARTFVPSARLITGGACAHLGACFCEGKFVLSLPNKRKGVFATAHIERI